MAAPEQPPDRVPSTQGAEACSRRAALRWLLAAGAGATLASSLSGCAITDYPPVVGPPPSGPRYKGERPNLVVVLVDDLAAEVVGGRSRFPFLETPHISRLEREGVSFQRAFVPTSVCSPSRASLLTGTYAHTHGVQVNDVQDLGGELPNFPALLKHAGYDTGFVGKWHMLGELSAPRLEFDYWLSFKGQGDYENPLLNQNGHEVRRRGYLTDLLTEYAVGWIQRPREGPMCLIVSHKAGHVPFEAAPRHAGAFRGARLPEPPNFAETFEDKPAWLRRYKLCGLHRDGWEACREEDVPAALPLEPWNARDERLLEHLRTLLAVDEGLGATLAALASVEQLDNTLVVFTSDNGFLLGAHRLFDKRTMHEESIRVPLTLWAPGRAQPSAPQALVSSLDIAPTLLELAGVTVPETMQGRSLAPFLTRPEAPDGWRDALLYEYFKEMVGPGVPTILGVRTDRWKYIHYPELPHDIDELYDLETDPFELHNLAVRPAYSGQLGVMRALLKRQLAETGYPEAAPG